MLKQLSDHLNLLMAKARINSSELARQTGLPATTIKRIRTYQQANPTISTLKPIADYFSITISELLNEPPSSQNHRSSAETPMQTLPLLSWQTCAWLATQTPPGPHTHLVTEKPVSSRAFALQVETDDFERLPKGALLIIEPAIPPSSGDYVIVTNQRRETASIKKYLTDADQIFLKSLIPGLNLLPYTADWIVLGTVVQYKIELK